MAGTLVVLQEVAVEVIEAAGDVMGLLLEEEETWGAAQEEEVTGLEDPLPPDVVSHHLQETEALVAQEVDTETLMIQGMDQEIMGGMLTTGNILSLMIFEIFSNLSNRQ